MIQSGLKFSFLKPEDRENCMIMIENFRRSSTYSHKCYEGCQKRGMYVCMYVHVYHHKYVVKGIANNSKHCVTIGYFVHSYYLKYRSLHRNK